jgi:hypothetical protein
MTESDRYEGPDRLRKLLQPGNPDQELELRKQEALSRQRLHAGRINTRIKSSDSTFQDFGSFFSDVVVVARIENDLRWVDTLLAAGYDKSTVVTLWDARAYKPNLRKNKE